MEFVNHFEVPADIDTTFADLTDLERLAPCLPGAVLESIDGDVFTGRVKVKVGPIQAAYRGTAQLVEVDEQLYRGRIAARGREVRGSGGAEADVLAQLSEVDGATRVEVTTTLQITGRPAQFGRSVLGEVGAQIIEAFADRVRTMLLEPVTQQDEPSGDTLRSVEPTPEHPAGVDLRSAAPAAALGATVEDNAPLDLLGVGGPVIARRAAPFLAGLVALVAVLWCCRRR